MESFENYRYSGIGKRTAYLHTENLWLQGQNILEEAKGLNLMSLQRRRKRYIILQMWKTLHCLCPNDVGITFKQSTRRGTTAVVPVLKRGSTQRYQALYDSSFAVLGPRLWNFIPSELTLQKNFDAFKNSLTCFLLTVPDKPPVLGYTCPNNNSAGLG